MTERSSRLIARSCASALALWVFAGCATVDRIDTPTGFARYDFGDRFEAISAEGVVVRAFVVEPPDSVDAAWSERRRIAAADHWLLARGARVGGLSTRLGEFDTRSGPAIAYEWSTDASVDHDAVPEWIVAIVVIVGAERWIVVDAGGPTDSYRIYEQTLFDAIERIDGVIDRSGPRR